MFLSHTELKHKKPPMAEDEMHTFAYSKSMNDLGQTVYFQKIYLASLLEISSVKSALIL